MQTFLPYPYFRDSAACLDRLRLGKQRVEVKQILNAITSGGAWSNHPATRMWRGHTPTLAYYGIVICEEWISRGYKDSLLDWFIPQAIGYTRCLPPWLGDPAFHASHRSNLLRKLPEHYSQFGWTESPDLPYVWPVP